MHLPTMVQIVKLINNSLLLPILWPEGKWWENPEAILLWSTKQPVDKTLNVHIYCLCKHNTSTVHLSPHGVAQVRAMVRDIMLCSWTRHLPLTVPLCTQLYTCKWVPANLMLGVTLQWTSKFLIITYTTSLLLFQSVLYALNLTYS